MTTRTCATSCRFIWATTVSKLWLWQLASGQGSYFAKPFDLTILDLNLASEDCLEMLNFIKGKDSKHPVIIFTAVDDDELFLKKALLGRADAVVRKMSSLTSLLAEVRQHLSKSSSIGQAHSGPGPRS